ncbi:hypothetical protein [Rhizobium rhizogenes]|uniref:hypothetical protein n=1 Tax=Rhizobium rhizogenes TaxID=359 RepID=UPI00226E6E44|nr:hypothetical protein [Rhizobium rhizogenes]
MTATNNFITELVRAANEIDRITDFEEQRLLDRAVTTIRDMREAIGIPLSGMGTDAAVDLQTVSALVKAGIAQEDTVRAALLDAAGMIRDLHIVLDTKTEILFEDGSQ